MDIKIISSGSQAGNAYLVSDGETTLILDAGVPLQKIQVASGFQLSKIAACLCTHAHKDHSAAISALSARGIDIYSGAETFARAATRGHRAHIITPLKKFDVGTFSVLPFDVAHDVETYGFMVTSSVTNERLLYITDASYVKYSFPAVDYMLIEANHDAESIYTAVDDGCTNARLARRVFGSHMSIDTLIEFLRANDLSKLEKIYLIHLSDNHSNAEGYRERIQRISGCMVEVC